MRKTDLTFSETLAMANDEGWCCFDPNLFQSKHRIANKFKYE